MIAPDKICICGHSESMHYAISGACMKIITRDSSLRNHLRCTCREFRQDNTQAKSKEMIR